MAIVNNPNVNSVPRLPADVQKQVDRAIRADICLRSVTCSLAALGVIAGIGLIVGGAVLAHLSIPLSGAHTGGAIMIAGGVVTTLVVPFGFGIAISNIHKTAEIYKRFNVPKEDWNIHTPSYMWV